MAVLQRKCACGGTPGPSGECEQCRKKRLGLQRAAQGPAPSSVPSSVDDVLNSPGQPLDVQTRSFMEARFGYDFSRVRVHADSNSVASARAVNALAYTVGQDVVFGSGQYDPVSSSGRHLLAHELTHVIQQRGRPRAVQHKLEVGDPDDEAEREAEETAGRVVSGGTASVGTRVTGALQRQQMPDQTQAPPPLTRAQERQLSRTSDGEVTGSANPFVMSLSNFAIDSADLKPRHQQALRELADAFSLSPTPAAVRITMRGHADDTGEPDVNNPLSRRRARAVQQMLQRSAGIRNIQITWAGEDEPVVPNDSVEGRNRNRRVDIQFEPTGRTPTPQVDPPPDTTDPTRDTDPPGDTEQPPRRRQDDGPENTWFCIEHPIICLAGLLPLLCLLFPSLCLPDPPLPPLPERTGRRPCLVGFPGLPSGALRVHTLFPFRDPEHFEITAPFSMNLAFMNDDTGCECGLGEYMQQVKGFVMRDNNTGTLRDDPPRNLPHLVGGRLERDTWREDLRGGHASMPYGQRSAPESENDIFTLPDRDTGCIYHGRDAPTVVSNTPGERIHFRLDFRGRAVDRRDRESDLMAVSLWRHWFFEWEGRIPPRTPPTPPPPPPGGGGAGPGPVGTGGGGRGPATFTPHRPAITRPTGGHPSFFAGGTLPRNPNPDHVLTTYTVILGFQADTGETFFTTVEVHVVSVTDTAIQVETTNAADINVAPVRTPPHREIILGAHRRFWINRSAIGHSE